MQFQEAVQYYGWRFDSIELKQVAKALKMKYQKVLTFLQSSQQVSFDLFIVFSFLVLAGMQDLSLVFLPISQLAARLHTESKTWSYLVQVFYLPFFRSLTDGYCFYSAIQLNWLEKKSLINLLILRILTLLLGLFFNHDEFYYRLLAASFD